MTEKIKIMTATYKNIRLPAADARRIRGFFANLDLTDTNLHNHTEDGTDIYRYPMIQYKVLNGNPLIVSAGQGIRSIHPHLMQQTELKIGDRIYQDTALDIKLSEKPLGDSRDIRCYQFITPWLALNQKNYQTYLHASAEERERLLSQILIGNILSLCKAFGVTIQGTLEAEHQLKPTAVLYKEKKMEAFTGKFQINCCIPELLGIGKGTARGFGTVKLDSGYERRNFDDR